MTKQLTVFRLLIPLHSLRLFDGLHVIDQIDPSNHRLTLCVRLSGTAASCPGCRTESRRVITGAAWVICRVLDARSSCACRSGAFGASTTPARAARSASPCRTSPVAGPAIPTACAPRITPSPWRWAAIREPTWQAGSACRSARPPLCAASGGPVPGPPPPPGVLGVDDWAWRKGSHYGTIHYGTIHYGTILCDLERGRRVELLPDRKSETL